MSVQSYTDLLQKNLCSSQGNPHSVFKVFNRESIADFIQSIVENKKLF